MIKKQGFPVKGELVLCTVKRIMPHGAFVMLDEYKDKEGMLHISEVSLKGVRDIKEHLSVNKQLVCKVLEVNEARGHIDLSLKRVKQAEMTRKLNESRLEKRLYKIIEYSCKKTKADVKKVINELLKNYDSLLELHDGLRSEGVELLNNIKLPSSVNTDLRKRFTELLEQIKVSITKTISLKSDEGDGLFRIKKLLNEFKSTEVKISVKYISAPKYMVTVQARNYKLAEQAFTKVFDQVQSMAGKLSVKVGLVG